MSERPERRWVRRAAALALAALAAGCTTKDGSPTSLQQANLAIQAQVSGVDGGSLRVHIYYDRLPKGAPPDRYEAVTLFDQTVPFATGTTTMPLVLDISGCLADKQRATTSGCEVVVDLSLVSGTTVLDEQVLRGVDLLPGQTTRLPNVVLTPVHSVVVAPALDTLVVGETVQLSDTVKDVTGQALTGRTVSWSTSDATVATVSTSGLVAAVAASANPVTITATSVGHSGSASIVVEPAPMMVLSADTIRFATTRNAAVPASQTVTVMNGGGGMLQGLSVAPPAYHGTSNGWLQATLVDSTVTLTILTTNLPASTDTALVIISSTNASNSPVAILVFYQIGQGPSIHLSQTKVAFTASAGGATPAAQKVAITNGGGGTLSGLALGSVTYRGASGWLSAALANDTVQLGVTSTKLTVGVDTAFVPVTSSTASNSPQTDTVVYTVTQGPVIHLTPTTLTFSGTAGGSNPASQQVAVTNTGGGTLSGLTATVAYPAGTPTGWLGATLGGSTAPTQVTVQPNIANLPLAADTLHATIVLKSSVAGVDSQTVAVTLQLASPVVPKLTPDTLTFNVSLGTTPSAQRTSVTNAGSGSLGTITTGTVQYGVGAPSGWGTPPTGWLSASVSGTMVTITITNTAVPLGGQFTSAIVPVSASGGGGPVNLVVHLNVTAQFTQVTVGRDHACALTKTQLAYCWGDNSQHRQLGDGTTAKAWPVPVPVAGGHTFASLSAGAYHTCGILADSTGVYCWGANGSGQLGDGTTTDHNTPVQTLVPASDGHDAAIAAGGSSTCVLVSSDHIPYCWGANDHLQVDPGASSPQLTPYAINAPTVFTALSAGSTHFCGLDGAYIGSGHEWCWGDNTHLQLAQSPASSGVALSSSSIVALDTSATATFAGPMAQTSCVTESASENIQCWGYNPTGNVGNKTAGGDVGTPAIVMLSNGSPVSSAVQVSTGAFHSCAVTYGGTTYCWGDDSNGELGNGVTTSTNQTTAVQVGGPTGFASVFASYYWTCGLGTNGRVYCWGNNLFGHLGQGGTVSVSTIANTPLVVMGQQ